MSESRGTYAIESLFSADGGRASILTLQPGDTVPRHRHSEVVEYVFVIEGTLAVETAASRKRQTLTVGQRCTIRPGVVHEVANPAVTSCRVLLVQTGRYDFLPVEGSEPAVPRR